MSSNEDTMEDKESVAKIVKSIDFVLRNKKLIKAFLSAKVQLGKLIGMTKPISIDDVFVDLSRVYRVMTDLLTQRDAAICMAQQADGARTFIEQELETLKDKVENLSITISDLKEDSRTMQSEIDKYKECKGLIGRMCRIVNGKDVAEFSSSSSESDKSGV